LKFKIIVDSKAHEIEAKQQNGRTDPSLSALSVDGKPFAVRIIERDEFCRTLRVRINEKEFKIGLGETTIAGGKPVDVLINDVPFQVKIETLTNAIPAPPTGIASQKKTTLPESETANAANKRVSSFAKVITPPMPGKIIAVKVKEGDIVKSGDVVLILEAMKMANEIKSPYAGKVKEVRVTAGQSVAIQDTLIAIE
jgi:glutaconyl-CoA decarboxylase